MLSSFYKYFIKGTEMRSLLTVVRKSGGSLGLGSRKNAPLVLVDWSKVAGGAGVADVAGVTPSMGSEDSPPVTRIGSTANSVAIF